MSFCSFAAGLSSVTKSFDFETGRFFWMEFAKHLSNIKKENFSPSTVPVKIALLREKAHFHGKYQ